MRSPTQLSEWNSNLYKESESATASLALNDDRIASKGHIDPRSKMRRLKGCMKQVVGGSFSRLKTSDWDGEENVVDALVKQAKTYFQDNIKPKNNEKRLRAAAEEVTKELRYLIGSRVHQYLNIITRRLFDHNVRLKLNFFDNNCQQFCDQLLHSTPFAQFLDGHAAGGLFSFSFATRPDSYAKDEVLSKWDVPFGLTEEYLLDFRSGRYNDSDIIDTLQEYWHDWGGFGRTLYKFQNLFPWDCTEAFDELAGKCDKCSLSKHVWSFPFDAFSITKLHLLRSYRQYPDEKKWDWQIENRLTVLLAQDSLVTVAKALSQLKQFREACAWLNDTQDSRLDRLKLGGIHRAQPFSHHFEQENISTVAPWIHLKFEEQKIIYEDIRDRRNKAPNVSEFSYKQALSDIAEKYAIDFGGDSTGGAEDTGDSNGMC